MEAGAVFEVKRMAAGRCRLRHGRRTRQHRRGLTIVRDGLAAIAPGCETDMPAFGSTQDDQEIMAILDYIKQRWPDREREIQQRR